MKVKIKKLKENAILPVYGSDGAAGADLASAEERDVVVEAGKTVMIGTGLAAEIPVGYVGLVFARSGLSVKRGLAPANKVGVIDSDYRGEIKVALYNQSDEPQTVLAGERIAQFVIVPFVNADFVFSDDLGETERGGGGFGSTGRK